jgi:hypothetical protein
MRFAGSLKLLGVDAEHEHFLLLSFSFLGNDCLLLHNDAIM